MAYQDWSELFNKTLPSVCAYNFSLQSFVEDNIASMHSMEGSGK